MTITIPKELFVTLMEDAIGLKCASMWKQVSEDKNRSNEYDALCARIVKSLLTRSSLTTNADNVSQVRPRINGNVQKD